MTAPPSSPTLAEPVADETPPPRPGGLGPLELARWSWRQLTSMRTALLLLLLLALAAVPGSVIPQSNIAAVQVSQWKAAHPGLAPIYEKLGLFSVFNSVWFSAIYLLLMVSLIGCILPRSTVYLRTLRAAPPRAPRNLARLPAYVAVESDEAPAVLVERARKALRSRGRRRYRVGATVGDETSGLSLGAERGYLREAGNLLFHVSVIVVLIGFAYGQLFGFKGGSIVLVGQGFSNSLTQYDDFAPGSLFDPASLTPMSLTVDSFKAKFLTSGPNRGQPVDFGADITYRDTPSSPPRKYHLAVNAPLTLNGVSVYLVGHGYAPKFTVRDGNGDVAYSGPVIFLPQDASFASFGVLKVPDAQPQQLGFEGMFFPTYSFTMARGPFSVFPDALNPAISMLAYHGNLGMDAGKPQSVFDLDKSQLKTFKRPDGRDFRLDMVPGQKVTLPHGLGSVRFDGWQRWVKLQVSNSPGQGIALTGVVLALIGLTGSLFIRRRRTWVRVTRRDGRSYVEVAGLDRSSLGEGLEQEVRRVAGEVTGAVAGDGVAEGRLA